jgi:integrase
MKCIKVDTFWPKGEYRMSNSSPPSGNSRPPKYLRQKRKGRPDRAYCRIEGKRIYLGDYGSKESRHQYAKVLGGCGFSAPPEPSTDPTTSELILAYIEYAEQYYRKRDGTTSNEYDHYVKVLGILRGKFGALPARKLGPKKLKAVRQELIDDGLSRGHVNKQTGRIVRMFKWAVAEEMVPPATYQALAAVEGLKRGRSDARETEPIRPVDTKVVDATMDKLPEVIADMVRVQLLTAMRPGELVAMRPQDINRSDDIWLYTPPYHKTDYRGHRRTIAVGQRAQAVLLRYLARAADTCCFQPRDSEAKRLAAQEANRKTPLSCGNRRGSNRKAKPKKQPGEQYSVDSYRSAIQRAAKRAKVESWAPHRLRHTRATEIRRDYGLDAAQAVLGHRGVKVTEVYAELEMAKAKEVARRIG